MDYQTQIDNLIELAIVQRDELKQLVEQLPQLRDYLSAEVEKKFEVVEPELRSELEAFFAQKTDERVEDLRGEVSERIAEVLKSLEMAASAKYAALMQEKDRAAEVLNQAEAKIAEVQAAIPGKVKELVSDELSRFPRANQIDQLRKEFAEPRGLNPRGKWLAGERYRKLDLVSHNGESYVSNVDDNTEKPSRSSAAWTLSAARGQGGGGGGITSLNDLIGSPTSDLDIVGAEGSNYVRKTLTAGANVTLTETPTEITISSTGGGGGTSAETLIANVTNAESVAITKGQVVYAFAATGNRVSVKLAYNTSDATSAKTFGVVSSASISAGGTGTVTCVGVVDGLNLGTFAEGDSVYLGATPGTFTATKPYAPNHLVYVGIVERANAGNGELYVRIQNGYELDEIHDVQINAPRLAGQTLIYDQTNDLWKNAQITGASDQISVSNTNAAIQIGIATNPRLNGQLAIESSSEQGLRLNNSDGNAYLGVENQENNASIIASSSLVVQKTYPAEVSLKLIQATNGAALYLQQSDAESAYIRRNSTTDANPRRVEYVANGASASHWFNTNVAINGNLTVSGTITPSGGGGGSAQVDVYSAPGPASTWTKPTGAKVVQIIAHGAGGGGGGGGSSATGNFRTGGGGGGGGACNKIVYQADALPSSLYVVIGAGGGGGATDAAGTAGGNSTVATNNTNPPTNGILAMAGGGGGGSKGGLLTQVGGGGGGGTAGVGATGTNSAAVSGGLPAIAFSNAAIGGQGGGGGYSNSSIGGRAEWGGGGGGATRQETDGFNSPGGGSLYGGGGGGCGRGLSAGGASQGGSGGGPSGLYVSSSQLPGGAVSGGAAAGSNGTDAGTTYTAGGGGGGGGSNNGGTGYAGGTGGFPSGGGGGGGASGVASSGGTGGAGANGRVVIITYF